MSVTSASARPDHALELRLLGEIEARRGPAVLALGGRRQQALLALLLLADGAVVSVDRLGEQLWAGEPPDSFAATIRTYVSRLRTTLGDEARLLGRSGGYRLDVADDAVDARQFERLVRDARSALGRGELRAAAARFDAGLALWRGQPLAGVADDGDLRVASDRLEELRLSAREDRIEVSLRLGEGTGLADEIEALVAQHPYRERLWRSLMLALARSGRTADALAAYQRAWRIFGDDLGLEPGEELRELEAAIVRGDLPLVRPADQRATLPTAMTEFVGRDGELGDVERQLGTGRLVTLTGIGGVGKTRLALEVGRRSAGRWSDGPWFVDLSAIHDPALVARAVAGVLDIVEQSDESVVDRLAARLRSTDALLILDNCEHLRSACAELAGRLLRAAPGLRILATSREPLGVDGEIDVTVPPLRTPAAHGDDGELASSDAVRLFVARARDARPAIDIDAAALASIAAICRDLDGLPLAIELAAARVKSLSVVQIADRLEDRFRFLVSWRRLAPDRHRTLKEAMDWSFDLLDESARALLPRLSIFAGGFTLEAVAAVCADGDESAAIDDLGRLVDASLVVAEERAAAMRYRLLETVRQYAAGRLPDPAPDGDGTPPVGPSADALADAHAAWFLQLAELTEPELTGAGQTAAFATLEAEHDNLRAALVRFEARGDRQGRLRLATALSRFWYVRGYLAESRRWLERALDGVDEAPPLLRRRALTAASAVALLQGDYPAGIGFSERGLAAARESGDTRLIANGLSNLGAIRIAAGDREPARTLLAEAVELARSIDDRRILALAINNLGDLALNEGQFARARPLFEESLGLLRERGDTANIARSLFNLGSVELMLGSAASAAACFRESLELGRETGDKEDLAWCLIGAAGVAARIGDGLRAAGLLGAAVALLDAIGAAFKPFERQLHDQSASEAERLLGPAAFEEARSQGAALPVEDAIGSALALVGGPIPEI